MAERTLVKVMSEEDLRRCSTEDRIRVNGVESGVLFPGEGQFPLFLRLGTDNNIYYMTGEGFEVTYTPQGEVKINSSWHRGGIYNRPGSREYLKELGVI